MNTINILTLKILRPFSLAIHRTKVWFRNLKFHWKLQLLILIPTLISYFAAIAFYDYSLNLYDQQLYEDSAAILSLSTQNIENEMKSLLNLTTQLSTDQTLQTTIRHMETSQSEYEQYQTRQKLMSLIYTSLNTRKYILSVTYINPSLELTTVGSDSSILLEGQTQELYDLAFAKSGKASWVNDSPTLLVCPIREVNNLSLRPMGAIVIRIQIDKLVRFTMNINLLTEDFFIYRNDDELLYHYGNQPTFIPETIPKNQNYSVIEANGQSSLVVRHSSESSDWSYYYAILHDAIFARFTKIKTLVLFLFTVIYLFLTVISIRFSASITEPLKQLAKQMKHVQDINFEVSNLSFSPNNRKDEIGQLQKSYQLMVKKIENLIQKNYRDQLLLQDTQYRVLQEQLNPHFIYNTLDSIYWLAVHARQERIATIVFSLGKLLRENMRKDATSQPLVSFRQELIILSYYLNIQKIRFHDKLDFRKKIAEDAYSCMVPRMLLQPLVENSISYGAEQIAETCLIELHAFVKDGYFYLELQDNGIGVEDNILEKLKIGERKPKGHGIGLSNIAQRLQLIYNADYGFSIEGRKSGGTRVAIHFPAD